MFLHFNACAPCGALPPLCKSLIVPLSFQFMRPVWGATSMSHSTGVAGIFQFMRPVWGATHFLYIYNFKIMISIYAPRVGRYAIYSSYALALSYFNLCAPCGALPPLCKSLIVPLSFQFMRPVWGATEVHEKHGTTWHISIYAPRVGRYSLCIVRCAESCYFNLCAPCGALLPAVVAKIKPFLFQFMRPVWGATFILCE